MSGGGCGGPPAAAEAITYTVMQRGLCTMLLYIQPIVSLTSLLCDFIGRLKNDFVLTNK